MMYGYGHGMGAWGWFAMASGTVLVWALLAVVAVVLYRLWTADRRRTPVPAEDRAAERVLAERFARGEIDETEYRSRLEVLRTGRR
ncbi:SHOCT domain-containing protein [Catenulispora subtropica]|uniref:SHOCT domain-containing protein n=1 Tax=Catenulispora subtropica TaxID=450798 RepID=A0ABP5EQP4_9ACTN